MFTNPFTNSYAPCCSFLGTEQIKENLKIFRPYQIKDKSISKKNLLLLRTSISLKNIKKKNTKQQQRKIISKSPVSKPYPNEVYQNQEISSKINFPLVSFKQSYSKFKSSQRTTYYSAKPSFSPRKQNEKSFIGQFKNQNRKNITFEYQNSCNLKTQKIYPQKTEEHYGNLKQFIQPLPISFIHKSKKIEPKQSPRTVISVIFETEGNQSIIVEKVTSKKNKLITLL